MHLLAAAAAAAAAGITQWLRLQHVQELVNWWEAAHYTVLQQRCAEAGMQDLAAKQATSLLRYIGAIPADKAFYEAGDGMTEFLWLDIFPLSKRRPLVCPTTT